MNPVKDGLLSLLGTHRNLTSRAGQSLETLGSNRKISHPKKDPVLYREISLHEEAYRKLEIFSNNLNSAASTVKIAMSSIEVADQQLELMKQKLNDAIFNPADSERRTFFLREFNRLVPLIDDVAKAPDAGARRLLDNPATYPDAGDLSVNAGPDGAQFQLTARPIYRGPGGVEVDLIADPQNGTDEEIRNILEQIELAREKLLFNSKAMGAEASAIERSINFNKVLTDQSQKAAEQLNTPDLNREATIVLSLQVRQSLAIEGIRSLSSNQELALQLMR